MGFGLVCFLNKTTSSTVLKVFFLLRPVEKDIFGLNMPQHISLYLFFFLIQAHLHVSKTVIDASSYRKMFLGLLSNSFILLIWNALSVLSVWLVHSLY